MVLTLTACLAFSHLARPIRTQQATYQAAPRFQLYSAIPALPAIKLDTYQAGIGLAQQTARSQNLQCRMLWIDATANLSRTNSEEKVVAMVDRIARAGFNTITVDIKPLSGETLYPSKIAPRMTEWDWGKTTLAPDFDPLAVFVREAKLKGLSLFVSLNALSEGHFKAKSSAEPNKYVPVGPGFAQKDLQTINYNPLPIIRFGDKIVHLKLPDKGWTTTDDAITPGFTNPGRTAFYAFDPKTGKLSMNEGTGIFLPSTPTLQVAYAAKVRGQLDTMPVFAPISENPNQLPLMMNPFKKEVTDRALSIVKEVVSNYAIDGFLYDDRLRFGAMNADFSPDAQAQFEKYVGAKVDFPDDVFKFTLTPTLGRGIQPGKYYDAWLSFRAATLQKFVHDVHKTVKETRPGTLFGIYSGSWYGEYAAFGNNYASRNLEAGFRYVSQTYQKTGFAELLDVLVTGCYYKTATVYDAMSAGTSIGTTVEAASELTNRVVRDQAWNYSGILLSDFTGNPGALGRILQAACGASQGVMVFDYSHDIDQFWPLFEQAFKARVKPPHAIKNLLQTVRSKRARLDKMGYRMPPVTIDAGQSGTGF